MVENPPAFPVSRAYDHQHGMDLRDWFAGQALNRIAQDYADGCDGYVKAVTARAYHLADAMLAARTKADK